MKEKVKICTDEFFTHPSWDYVLDIIREYIRPLKEVSDIDMNRTSDEIATEVRARQITVEKLEKFISDSLTLQKIKKSVPTTTRKFK